MVVGNLCRPQQQQTMSYDDSGGVRFGTRVRAQNVQRKRVTSGLQPEIRYRGLAVLTQLQL